VLDKVTVPVVASGGIGTARSMAAAMSAGAEGVRIGTRFVASAESMAHPAYKEALIKAAPEDTVVTAAFAASWPNAPARVLRSALNAAEMMPKGAPVGEMDVGGQKMPVQRLDSPAPLRTTTGKIEAMALYAGESVGAVNSIQPAAEIIKELVEGAEYLLTLWAPQG
jgi:NAD(P)H-dependent flavin oxidoreductase YrpB (nitropropane dioxygenase family)